MTTPTGTPPAAITPQGVRDGEPAVLAALAARRGPAVVAFAEQVCDPAYVVRASADAFARFRASVADPGADMSVHPDALLLRCARRAAIDLAPVGPDLGCAPAAELLAARAERTIKPRDAALLNRHLESCEHCRALADSLDAADRAYREADDAPLPGQSLAAMVAALAAAAPVRLPEVPNVQIETAGGGDADVRGREETDEEEIAPLDPEPEEQPEGPDEPDISPLDPQPQPEEDDEPEEQPATEPVGEAEPEPAPEPEAEYEPEVPIGTRRVTGVPAPYYEVPSEPPRERGRRAKKVAAAGAAMAHRAQQAAQRRRQERAAAAAEAPFAAPEPEPIHVEPEPEPEPELVYVEPEQPVAEFDALDLPADPELEQESARAAARHYRRLRHRLQREERLPADGRPPRLERPSRDRGPHLPLSAHGPRDLALPAGLLVLAALVIMAVSGVFGGGSDSPTTGTSATAPPEVALVTQSATSISLSNAELIAARAGTPAAP